MQLSRGQGEGTRAKGRERDQNDQLSAAQNREGTQTGIGWVQTMTPCDQQKVHEGEEHVSQF